MKPQIIKAKDLKPGDLLIHDADHEKISVGSFKFIKSIEKPKKIDKDNKDERLVFFYFNYTYTLEKAKAETTDFLLDDYLYATNFYGVRIIRYGS